MADPIDNFPIAEAARLSRLTKTMIDYLCREKVLVPSGRARRGRGRPRMYSFGDVVMLRVISRLLQAGVSVKRLKRAFQALRPQHREISRESLPAKYLVTDGRQVYLRDEGSLILLDGTGQQAFYFVLELEELRQDVLSLEPKGYAHARA